jgi:3-oxocholest-4-en-26-oate---CoA ligase
MPTRADRTPLVVGGMDGLRGLVGRHLGYSDWHDMSADRVGHFAAATGDQQWIHVDPERAAASRFGGPIAHGYLVLSLGIALLEEVLVAQGFTMSVNYGCDRVRFLAPVPVGAQIRTGATLKSLEDVRGGGQLSLTMVVQIRDGRVPACVARILQRNYV